MNYLITPDDAKKIAGLKKGFADKAKLLWFEFEHQKFAVPEAEKTELAAVIVSIEDMFDRYLAGTASVEDLANLKNAQKLWGKSSLDISAAMYAGSAAKMEEGMSQHEADARVHHIFRALTGMKKAFEQASLLFKDRVFPLQDTFQERQP